MIKKIIQIKPSVIPSVDFSKLVPGRDYREYELSCDAAFCFNDHAGWPPNVQATVHNGEIFFFKSTSGATWTHSPVLGLHGPEGLGAGGEGFTVPTFNAGALWTGLYQDIDAQIIYAADYRPEYDKSRGGIYSYYNNNELDWNLRFFINDKPETYDDNRGSVDFTVIVMKEDFQFPFPIPPKLSDGEQI